MTAGKYSFDRYLNVRSAYGASFSPDGRHLSFLTDITGVAEVWNVPIDIHSPDPSWPDQLTFRGERVASAAFSPTDDTLLVTADIGGNERTQLYTLSADGSTFTGLTDQPDVIYQFGDWSPDGKSILYSSNERDGRYFDVYELSLENQQSQQLLQQDGTNYPISYSPDGSQVLVSRHESNTRNQLILINRATRDTRTLTPPSSDAKGPAEYANPAWSADRRELYLLSNAGRQFLSLARLDLTTSELTYLRDEAWDAEQLALTDYGTRMALVTNEDGYSRLELFDVSAGWDARRELPVPTLPQGTIPEIGWSPDGTRLALTLNIINDAPDIWVWDVEEQILWRATRSSLGGIPQDTLIMPSLVHYPTFDGREIPAFLYLPQNRQSRGLPIVIYVHG